MKRKTAYLGLFSAVAIILGYMESLIPVFAGIPGIKLGLQNLAVIFILAQYSCVRCQDTCDWVYVWKSVQYFI